MRDLLSSEKGCAGSLLLLIIYTAWARGGLYGPWFLFSSFLFLLMLVSFVFCLTKADASVRGGVFKDPLLLVGGLLCLLLLVQWLNAGRHLFLNIFTGEYAFAPPPRLGIPFSVDATESWQPLLWFAPALLMLLAVRHLFSRQTLKWLLLCLLLNGVLLALFGIIQFALGWDKMFGVIELPQWTRMVASFAYTNHGGAFFYLMVAFALGMLRDGVEKGAPLWKCMFFAGAAIFFAGAAFCSLSRAAVVAVVLIVTFVLVRWVWGCRRMITAGGWVNVALMGCLTAVVLYSGIVRVGNGAVSSEIISRDFFEKDASYYRVERGFLIPPALEMVKAYPLFGVGGWGYRHFAKLYLPHDQWHRADVGKANVHCDPVQFLAEHGVVGFGLLTAALGLMLVRWRGVFCLRYRGLSVVTGLGCLLVLLHGLIDLPFRCPALLWHWVLLMAIVPQLACESRAAVRNK